MTNVSVSGSDLTDLVGGNSAFAFDLYHALGEKDRNLFYSPYSISVALAMTYAGARGETERQMADTMHYRLSQDKLHNALNALDLKLTSREKDGEGFRLNLANAIWGQSGYQFTPEFLDVLALNYGAGLRSLNYAEARRSPERPLTIGFRSAPKRGSRTSFRKEPLTGQPGWHSPTRYTSTRRGIARSQRELPEIAHFICLTEQPCRPR